MKISKEDPRLTAYALGEIEDPQERNEIEEVVAADPALQAEVDSIRGMGDWLAGGLDREAAPELSEFEKAKLGQSPDAGASPSWMRRLISWPVVSTAAAAALALLLIPQWEPIRIEASREAPRILVPEPTAEDGTERSEKAESQIEDTASIVNYSLTPRRAANDNSRSSVPGRRLPLTPLTLMSGSFAYSESSGTFGGAPSVAMPEPETTWNTESYDPIEDSDFRSPQVAPLSTFSIDVDTASYANVRRFLNQGQMPPADAVRIEELVNYFNYEDAPPTKSLEEGGDPFAVHMAQASAPWNQEHRLLRVALKGYEMPWEERPASNLVFLLDVSGSMSSANKLPLVKEAMQLLTRRLDERDRVAIVVYAGASGLVLPSTTANNTETIEHALTQLKSGGSTNAGAGVQLAYKLAREHFIEGGNNRVILCTDGDFNVGQTNRGELTEIASEQAEEGVSLTILGFGMGNYKDDMLEDLSNKGKGSYAYIDSRKEARKVFLEDLASNIFKIAKDVKIQVEFNPEQVQAYRLIGYENRRLKAEDFNNDKKKAGDIGPGHTVVALYEIVPPGAEIDLPGVDELRYQQKDEETEVSPGEVATVKLRYKRPEEDASRLITRTAHSDDAVAFEQAHEDFRFGAAVAGFGFKLRGSDTVGDFGYREIEGIAADALGQDSGGHRSEFTDLVRKAEQLSQEKTKP